MVIDPSRKPNSTQAARHFTTSAPIEEQYVLPPHPTWNYSRPMKRLTIGVITPKESRSIYNLWELITRRQIDCRLVFPDTGFITTEVQQQFWELGTDKIFLFSEMTTAELSGWINNPIHNEYLHAWLPRALEACKTSGDTDGPIRRTKALGTICNKLIPFWVGVLTKSEMNAYGYDYYVDLLSLRKRLGIRVANELRKELGREPQEREVRDRLNRDYHPRVMPIAIEGWKKAGARNYTADEEMIVSSVISAVVTGQSSMILTRDTDVFDQFIKMFELMTAQYMCYRFGEVRAANPDGVPMGPLTVTKSDDSEFLGNTIEHAVIPQSEADRLPPYSHTPVHCYCVLVGNHAKDPRISIAGYCLETEMAGLLHVKGKTGGKNTYRFPGKNISIGTHQTDGRIGILFALGEERMIDYEGVRVSIIDLMQTFKDDPAVIRKIWSG